MDNFLKGGNRNIRAFTRKLLILLATLALAITITIAYTSTMTSYPDVVVLLDSYGTYISWTQALSFDTLTVNASTLTLANAGVGTGTIYPSLAITQQNANLTIEQLHQNQEIVLDVANVTGTANSTTTLTLPSEPSNVFLDGLNMAPNNGWAWNTGNSTLTLWVSLSGAHTSSQWTISQPSATPTSGLGIAGVALGALAFCLICGYMATTRRKKSGEEDEQNS